MLISIPSLLAALQGFFLILIAPGLVGLLKYLKAELLQRRRPPVTILHPYWDLLEMAGRPAVHAKGTSIVFAIAPFVILVAYSSLAFVVPVFQATTFVAADLVVIISLLALARFTISLVGLDIASSFAWLGSTREMFYQFNTEIGFALFLAASAARWNTTNLTRLAQSILDQRDSGWNSVTIFLAIGFFIIILFEAGRLPIDNQETPYELTMGQRGVLLEYAGRELALFEWGEMIKLVFLLTMFANLVLPFGILGTDNFDAIAYGLADISYPLRIGLILAGLAIWEISRPKMRLRAVADYTWMCVIFLLVAIVLTLIPK
ncbi:MAG: NADH-quinone oxidoreductase subunit H [Anaerolineae bacterium]